MEQLLRWWARDTGVSKARQRKVQDQQVYEVQSSCGKSRVECEGWSMVS